jgi:uncharacterized protein with GYD domain
MAKYLMLMNFTEQGIRNVKDTVKRADAFRALAKKHKANVKEVLWTLGQYDGALVIEAPDDETMTALALSSGQLGNVRTQVLRAFTADEMGPILSSMSKPSRGR